VGFTWLLLIQDPKDAMLREFQEEIKRLKAMLEVSYDS
jgi:hypothetical protein